MRYFFLLIISQLSLTACFTAKTLKKAKLDRKPELVDSVLTSYKDTNGNAVIVYTKQNEKAIYKTVVPFDTIISKYRQAESIDFVNPDTTINNFKGVFYAERVNNQRGFQRIILFDDETPLRDTAGLYKEIGHNEHLVTKYTGRNRIPLVRDGVKYHKFITAPAVSFIVQPIDSSSKRGEMYIIAFEPDRRKYSRYLLVPLTAGLDGVTLPGQIIGVGFLYLMTAVMRF